MSRERMLVQLACDCRNDYGRTMPISHLVLQNYNRTDPTLLRTDCRIEIRIVDLSAFDLISHIPSPLGKPLILFDLSTAPKRFFVDLDPFTIRISVEHRADASVSERERPKPVVYKMVMPDFCRHLLLLKMYYSSSSIESLTNSAKSFLVKPSNSQISPPKLTTPCRAFTAWASVPKVN